MFISNLRVQAPKIAPTLWFPLDTNYCGKWLVVGSLDGDGHVEFICARNENQLITAMAAYRQDGSFLWTWGVAGSGSSEISYDLPLQIYDINNDGKCEVICGIKNYILILDGLSGKEIVRHPLPNGLEVADCITFANLKEKSPTPKSDIILKSRYGQVWAYTNEWTFLWTWRPSKDIKTCHHPTPVDINDDGFDEVLVGNEMVDRNGKKVWEIKSRHARKKGHLDCAQIVQKGTKPEDFRIVFTYCGSNFLAMMDGNGQILWEQKGKHFESIDVGFFNRTYHYPQFYTDIDHTSYGEMEGMMFDFEGHKIGTYKYDTGRFHRCVDWNGDGLDEIVISPMLSLVNGSGQKIGEFQFNSEREEDTKIDLKDPERFLVSIIDLTGEKNGDIVIHSAKAMNIYHNPSSLTKTQRRFDDFNFTLY